MDVTLAVEKRQPASGSLPKVQVVTVELIW